MARRAITVAVALITPLLGVSGPVDAATIYGMIRENNHPVVNAPIVLDCAGTKTSTNTDGRGTYRLTLDRTGRCNLTIRGVPAQVILYVDPSRYDFEISGGSGPTRLIRR
jgi:hypothetical protein